MKVEFVEKKFTEVKAGALILVLTKEDVAPEKGSRNQSSKLTSLFREDKAQVEAAIKGSEFNGDKDQRLTIYSVGKHRVVFLVGVGEKSQLTSEKIRRAAAAGIKSAQSSKVISVVLSALDSSVEQVSDYETVHSLLEGAILGAYKFDKYLTQNKKSSKIDSFIVAIEDVQSAIGKKAAKDAHLLCEAVYLARDLSNAPANEIYPEALANVAVKMAKRYHVRARILDEKQIKKLKMGGLLAVNSGSAKPPRFITLEYKGNSKSRNWYAIVGKGITFDSGGISLKPAAGMGEMKMDMSGAAVVIGTIQALASLKIPVNVVGIAPSTENLPGGSAYKPGDIVTTMSGITIEVDNTDAEGRIILSDGLYYAQRYRPKAIIDLATLTGACVVALGQHATGMFGTGEDVMAQLKEAGEKTYERVWQLPIYEEYEKQIKSDVADVKNVGGKWAGAITAALFLKKFVGDYPWVHLDIAGTAMLEDATDYAPKGGSGVGVRLLTQFFKQVAS
ncbi:MAG: leucyl aminopeptidase [Bacteroidetes bacterium]|nr:leucyl aminopeptidase [Bacteroidota bacterium]MCL5739169.1 leucyl aminopeptidase [Bacteroidota bacterium]